MKRRNGKMIEEARERQATGCFIPSDSLITGRTTLREKDFKISQGAPDSEPNQEQWTSYVPRVLTLLEPDQVVEVTGTLNGEEITAKVTRSDKFLNAELTRYGVPFKRCTIAVRSENSRWYWTAQMSKAINLAPESSWVIQLYTTYSKFN